MKKAVLPVSWSPCLAYAIGLLVTDGSLSSDGRHIDISSVDREQLQNFMLCLGREYTIGIKKSGTGNSCFRIQFSDVKVYRFLSNIGITPRKSKSIGPIAIPKKYFFDFLRGHFDGDGTFYAYQDARWINSFMFYLCFVSASENHIRWIRSELKSLLDVSGSLTKARTSSVFQLKYAKRESLVLIKKLYYNHRVVCLSRKREKIEKILREEQKRQVSAGAVMVARLA